MKDLNLVKKQYEDLREKLNEKVVECSFDLLNEEVLTIDKKLNELGNEIMVLNSYYSKDRYYA